MQEGTIARKIADKHFGFIKRANGEGDLFFHESDLQNVAFNELNEGDKVTFEVADSPKGDGKKNAVKINRV